MKTKIILALLTVLAIAVGGTVVFFITRPQPQQLLPQTFAQLPKRATLVAEFNHGPHIRSVAISPTDTSLIASVGNKGTIKLWRGNNTRAPIAILDHPGEYASIGFSPKGKLLASVSYGKLVLWDVASRTEINTLEAFNFAFSPDGHQLATVYKGVKLWNIRNPKKITEIATLPFDEAYKARGWAYAVNISPDAKLIAVGYSHGTVNVWNLQTKQHIKTLKTVLYQMNYLKFSPDNRFLVCGGSEYYDKWHTHPPYGYTMWKLPSWQRHGEVLRGNIDNLVFSPDGKIGASANDWSSSGRGVELWSVENGAPITLLPTAARDAAFSQDGSMLAIGGWDGVLQVWKLGPHQSEAATAAPDKVRLIYFVPKYGEPLPNITQKLDKSIREARDFYADEMERHGFGRKTFTFETDENGKVKIYLVKRGKTRNYDLTNNIWLGIIDDSSENSIFSSDLVRDGLNETFGYPTHRGPSVKDNIRFDRIEGITPGRIVFTSVKTLNRKSVAYALKNAFGLPYIHSKYELNVLKYKRKPNALKRFFYRVNNLMPWGKKPEKLSKCEAEWLDRSRFFSSNQPFFDKRPNIEMSVLPADAPNSRRFQFQVADEDGMQQAQLFVPIDLKNQRWIQRFHDFRTLKGKKDTTVEFEISDPEIMNVKLQMIDMHGNIASRMFRIEEKGYDR